MAPSSNSIVKVQFLGHPVFYSLLARMITLTNPLPPGEIAGAQPVMKSGSRKNQRATWEKENQLILLLKTIHFERKNIHDISKIVPFQLLGEEKCKDGNSRIKMSHNIFRLNISKYIAQQNITEHIPHQNGEGH